MPKSFSPPPPAYDLHNFNKTASTIQLTSNEITQSKEKLREKNATRDGPLRTSDFGGFIHIVKSSCGSGFLAMPDAFKNIGILLGTMGTIFIGLVSAHCLHLVGFWMPNSHHQEQLWFRISRDAKRLQEHWSTVGSHGDFGAFLHVMKSSLGSGFLAMPHAFHNIGLLMGVMGTVLVALVCTHCTYIVVKCSQELCYQQGKIAMTYTETVESAFKIGARGRFDKWSKTMMYVSNFFLFITYYGVNTVYVILIASSFKQVIENHMDYTMNIRWYALVLLILLLPIGIIRHIKFLVPFSALANLFLLIGCSLTLYFCFIDIPPISSRPMVVEVARWPLFFSTALFGMEGIGTVMPIENAMRHPKHFLGCPGVLNFGMTVVASVFLVMGAIGYLKYGEAVEGSITLNLPQDPLSEAVKILVALAILFTYPLQLTASMEVVWQRASRCFSEKKQDQGYYLVRALMIIGTVIIAIAVPNLSPVLSLVGAIGFSGLGLLLPTVTELVTYWDVISKPFGLTVIKDAVIILIWAFATIFGTFTSVQEIIHDYKLSK